MNTYQRCNVRAEAERERKRAAIREERQSDPNGMAIMEYPDRWHWAGGGTEYTHEEHKRPTEAFAFASGMEQAEQAFRDTARRFMQSAWQAPTARVIDFEKVTPPASNVVAFTMDAPTYHAQERYDYWATWCRQKKAA